MSDTETESETLYAMAQQACRDNPDAQDAINALAETIAAEDDLRDDVIRRAAASLVYAVRHQTNYSIRQATTPQPSKRGLAGMRLAGEVLAESILNMTLPSGKRIGDVMGADLAAESERLRLIAQGSTNLMRFCEALRPLVKSGQRVRDAVKETRAAKIWTGITGEALAVTA